MTKDQAQAEQITITQEEIMDFWQDSNASSLAGSYLLAQKNLVRITLEILCLKYNWRMPSSLGEIWNEAWLVTDVVNAQMYYTVPQLEQMVRRTGCAAVAYAWKTREVFSDKKLKYKSFREILRSSYPYLKQCLDSAVDAAFNNSVQPTQITGNVSTGAPQKLSNYIYIVAFSYVITEAYRSKMDLNRWAERPEFALTQLSRILTHVLDRIFNAFPISDLEFARIRQNMLKQLLITTPLK